jgi:hypothetical protein
MYFEGAIFLAEKQKIGQKWPLEQVIDLTGIPAHSPLSQTGHPVNY